MATHSGILAWRTPWTEEPGGLQSMGLQRVGYNLATAQQQQQFWNKLERETELHSDKIVNLIIGR